MKNIIWLSPSLAARSPPGSWSSSKGVHRAAPVGPWNFRPAPAPPGFKLERESHYTVVCAAGPRGRGKTHNRCLATPGRIACPGLRLNRPAEVACVSGVLAFENLEKLVWRLPLRAGMDHPVAVAHNRIRSVVVDLTCAVSC